MTESPALAAYFDTLTDPQRKADTLALHRFMQELTQDGGHLWGSAIAAYGPMPHPANLQATIYHLSFSPNGRFITVHTMKGIKPHLPLLEGLGRHETRKDRLLLRSLAEIDLGVLRWFLLSLLGEARAFKG